MVADLDPDSDDYRIWKERRDRLWHFIAVRYGGNQASFARASRATSNKLQNYLKNHVTPDTDQLLGFADAGLNPLWFLSNVGPMDMQDLMGTDYPPARVDDRSDLHEIRELIIAAHERLDAMLGVA